MRRIALLACCLFPSLANFAQNYTEPSFSPDGKMLVFALDTGGKPEIHTARADGAALRKIAGLPGFNVHPRWAPDGSKILFNCFPETSSEPHDVFIVNADGANRINLTQGSLPDGQADDWAPDGKRILISGGKYPGINLYTIRPDGSDLRQLTFEKNRVSYYASWSPDGKKILFTGFSAPKRSLFLMDADGANLQEICPGGDAPRWAPDGSRIAFQLKRDDQYFLRWMQPGGTPESPVPGQEIEGETPAWAPDGKKLVFQRKSPAGFFEIWTLDLATGRTERILPKIPVEAPVYNPAEAICQHIETLASDAFQGRKPGTQGAEKAMHYIKEAFRKIGLAAGNGDSYYQPVDLAEFSTIPPVSIRLQGKNGSLDWQLRRDFLLSSRKAQESIRTGERQLVFVGFGIHAPEIGWDDYAQADVRGKIVVALSGSPDAWGADATQWKGDPAANLYGQSFYKRNEALSRGAVGLLLIYRQPEHNFWNWESLGANYGQADIFIKRKPDDAQLDFGGMIAPNAAEQLFQLAGLADYNYEQEALKPGFTALDLPVHTGFSFSNTWRDIPAANVVGLLPGTDKADEVVVYTAHYDHVGIGAAIDGDSIYNGAVDNASGTAALIEIARAYKALPEPPRRSVLFVATTAEEMGLLGAVWYAAYPLFPLGKTAAAFNMDAHFPYGKTKYVTGVVYGRSELDGYLEEAARKQGRMLIPNTEDNIKNNIFFRSDHFPLAEAGIPAEFAVGAIGVADSATWMRQLMEYMGKYHQPTDAYTADFDCNGIWQDAELIFEAGKMLTQSNHFPAWNTDQPFERFRRENRHETAFFEDLSEKNLPVMALLGRSMDAAVADVDADGDLDIVVANEHNFNILLLNDGQGRFTDGTQGRLPFRKHDSEDIALTDFDGDGDPDLIFVSEDDQLNEYFENDGKGVFRDISYKLPARGTSNAVAAIDLNGDGHPDLLIGNAPDRQNRGGQNVCLLNDGKGNWTDATAARLPASTKATQDLELGDIDGDGDSDLIVANEDDCEILINNGQGIFSDETAVRLPLEAGKWETREARLADVDVDGDLDLFLANVNFRQNKDPQNRLFINDGKGVFRDETATRLPVEATHTLDAKFLDLNGDGHPDLLTANSFGASYTACFNDGKGTFSPPTEAVFPASCRGDGLDIEVADFNGDGQPDLYLCNFQGHDFLLFGKK
ncbi:MAG: VCBS repeat-containing protein [Lewinellaceae bacterium]|nr:VCBS repeat-containing protein [Lewinellaceae bacterium]